MRSRHEGPPGFAAGVAHAGVSPLNLTGTSADEAVSRPPAPEGRRRSNGRCRTGAKWLADQSGG
jgi:hypothetical protein